MKHRTGKDADSTDVIARFALAKKKRNARRVKKREKQAYLKRITEEANDRDTDVPVGHNPDNRARRLKRSAIRAYGGSCLECGEKRLELLELDHVEGDGSTHRAILTYGTARRGVTPAGGAFYARLRKLGYPRNIVLVVLCKSCHQTKTLKARLEGKNG